MRNDRWRSHHQAAQRAQDFAKRACGGFECELRNGKRISDACSEANCRFAFKIMKSGFVAVFFRSESHDAQDNAQVGAQDAAQVSIRDKILACCQEPRSRTEIAAYCGYKSVRSLMQSHLKPLLESVWLRMTIPDKPNSRNQKYVAVKTEG